MKSLPTGLREAINKIGSGEPYAWLFAAVQAEDWSVDPPAGAAIYCTSYDREITYANLLTLPVGNKVYQPFGMRVGTIRVDTTGSTPALQVGLSNVFRDISYRLDSENGLGFLGHRCVFAAVDTARLGDGDLIAGEGIMRGAAVDGTSATFSIELYGLSSIEVPEAVFIVDRCRYKVYGSEECGFPLDLVTGSHPVELRACPKTFAACKARGDFVVGTLNRPRNHPMRFGGFLGLPRLLRR